MVALVLCCRQAGRGATAVQGAGPTIALQHAASPHNYVRESGALVNGSLQPRAGLHHHRRKNSPSVSRAHLGQTAVQDHFLAHGFDVKRKLEIRKVKCALGMFAPRFAP